MAELTYEYQPIQEDEIRLLQIYKAGDEVRYDLAVFTDNAAPTYSALSYAWGSELPTQEIELWSERRVLRITQHLLDALNCCLSQKSQLPRQVWIDAICIDQTNVGEKSLQVQKMDRIFSKADCVVIWLGLADKGIDDILESSALVSFSEKLHIMRQKSVSHFPSDKLVAYELPSPQALFWKQLGRLFGRAWFSRGWVVQEIVVAEQTVFACGHHFIPWSLLLSIAADMTFLSLDEVCLRYEHGSLVDLIDLDELKRSYRLRRIDLYELLVLISSKELSKPIDRIYCLYGLFDENLRRGVAIDYKKEETFWEPIVEVIQFAARDNFDFRMLHHGRHNEEIDLRMPSWCPSLGRTMIHNVMSDLFQSGFLDETRRSEKKLVRVTEGTSILEIHGFKVDIVRDLSLLNRPWTLMWDSQPPTTQEVTEFLEWETECRNIAMLALGGSPNQKKYSYYRTMICDTFWQGSTYESPAPHNIQKGYEELLKECRQGTSKARIWKKKLMGLFDRKEADHRVQLCKTELSRCCLKSLPNFTELRLFSTQYGHVGVGPPGLKAGDIVCIFYGAEWPFILRQDSRDAEAIFVGPAFVHGLMDLNTMPSEHRGPDEIFRIK